tara:strand:- start:38 stop:253 length:216 start_codon:yes stop_codon:yes gene_type:complete
LDKFPVAPVVQIAGVGFDFGFGVTLVANYSHSFVTFFYIAHTRSPLSGLIVVRRANDNQAARLTPTIPPLN